MSADRAQVDAAADRCNALRKQIRNTNVPALKTELARLKVLQGADGASTVTEADKQALSGHIKATSWLTLVAQAGEQVIGLKVVALEGSDTATATLFAPCEETLNCVIAAADLLVQRPGVFVPLFTAFMDKQLKLWQTALLGAGIGAAGGAAIGAAFGIFGGPLGVIIGLAVGAVVGACAGAGVGYFRYDPQSEKEKKLAAFLAQLQKQAKVEELLKKPITKAEMKKLADTLKEHILQPARGYCNGLGPCAFCSKELKKVCSGAAHTGPDPACAVKGFNCTCIAWMCHTCSVKVTRCPCHCGCNTRA